MCERGAHAEAPEPEIPLQRLKSPPAAVRSGVWAGRNPGHWKQLQPGAAVVRQGRCSVLEISAVLMLNTNDETDRIELKKGKISRSKINP